jgi:hypothetical protein
LQLIAMAQWSVVMFQSIKRLYRRLFYIDYVVIGNIPRPLEKAVPPGTLSLDAWLRNRNVPPHIIAELRASGVTSMMGWEPQVVKPEPPLVTGWLLTGDASQAAWDAETSKRENDKV